MNMVRPQRISQGINKRKKRKAEELKWAVTGFLSNPQAMDWYWSVAYKEPGHIVRGEWTT